MQNKDYLTNLMDFMYKRLLSDIKCAYVAKIVKLTKPTAKIQPLAMLNNKKQPMVENAYFLTLPYWYKCKYIDTVGKEEIRTVKKPIILQSKLNYKNGDNVLVVVLDHDDEYFKNQGQFKVESNRSHAIDFSVIVGKIASKNDFKQ